ncbi:N-acylneuraminate cytidylyltransferase [Flavobacterium glycines]|uniref:N-acylneuraminate cytidylyltransferase n=1 Tax=Flavobacterium glycines TaxID=551990 RepID=A0A1B9DH79_9FLAO|nr:acylneuraminate cytidylyltransferase [Flavobacterium glycines]OCB69051.1 cytidyltransferase [Flavobacterium glycines]GEL12399.1 acylneuraminate cytidylyltransferase [Flavobacterium glycines]SDJ52807.1 N-acylneuraminate cytidylyltransferase [Flavobacterium glycines]
MKKTAIIPLRKDSKGIPGKNKKKMLGRPLFSWVLTEAIFSDLDTIYIFTDDKEIVSFIEKEYHWTLKVKALLRNAANATDTASTESAMLEFAEQIDYDFDILCLLQATSAMTTATAINAVLDKIEIEKYDSALTVVNTHRFSWNADGTPQNYDVFNRPRRQDFEGLLIENGAAYATTKAAFVHSKNRVSAKTGLVQMPENTLVEIDSMTDWKIVEELLTSRLKKAKKHHRIDYLVLDVDGVFTNGQVFYSAEGELAKAFDMRDGMGLEILRQNQVEVVVMTSENSPLVAQRMKKLQIENTFLGVKDKYAFLQHFVKEKNTSFNALAYIGDDVNDLANICAVGWSFAPANATEIVKQNADYLLTKVSAAGAIREACEWIMKYNERY